MAVGHGLRVALATIVLFAVAAAAQATAAPMSSQRVVGLERQLLAEVNEARAVRGLRALTVSPGLRATALTHSRAMLDGGFFAHESADGSDFAERLKKLYSPPPNGSWAVGENLYYSSVQPTAEETVQAWLTSASHRGILLSPHYREVGIGVVRSALAPGDFGNRPAWVVTADFGARTSRTAAATKHR
jgi:uncharacterized protein YkwD